MSDDVFPTPEDGLDELALRYALGSVSEDERARFETCMGCPHSKAAALAAEYRDVVAGITAAALPACAPPAPEVKARIFEAIRQGDRPPVPAAPASPALGLRFIAREDQPWVPTPFRGVRLRELSSASPDFTIVLLSLEPGAKFPSHDHSGAEDIYVLEGEASMEGRQLRAGDFLHWEPGTRHHEMISPGGCRAMIITSNRNYPSRLVHSYSFAHRLVARVGRALGMKSAR